MDTYTSLHHTTFSFVGYTPTLTKAKYLISLGKLEKHKALAPSADPSDNKVTRRTNGGSRRTDGQGIGRQTNAARVQTTPMPQA
jgi:hypothetical protein